MGQKMERNLIILWCSRRDSDPPEYPAALLDPRACAHELLRRIYARIPIAPPIDKDARDTEIYQRYQHGTSPADLAQEYGLSIQWIRRIIRWMARRDPNESSNH